MGVKIVNFGGELPSVSPRALPDTAGQTHKNLYALTPEFRPLLTDTSVAACPSGTSTLYRFARAADGTFNQDFSSGWLTHSDYRSYVKGQINDELTERTYVTFDDGSARPRVLDVSGGDRVLGVPRPTKPTVTLNASDELTAEEAAVFVSETLGEALRSAIAASIAIAEPSRRYSGSTILSGPRSTHSLLFPTNASVPASRQSQYWNLFAEITNSRASAINLDLTRCNATQSGSNTYVGLVSLPGSAPIDAVIFNAALSALEHPTTGQQLLDQGAIDTIRGRVIDALDPDTLVGGKRDALDAIAKEFYTVLTSAPVDSPLNVPTEPTKPTVPEYDSYTFDDNGGSTGARASAWVAYDAAMIQYREDLAAYNESLAKADSSTSGLNDKIADLQSRATTLTQEIEAIFADAVTQLTQATGSQVASFIESIGGAAGLGINTTTRIIDTRFYVVTFVTDRGEESQASLVSDMLEVDQNDTVTIARPSSTSGESYASRNIVKWRIYRTNTGSASASFQFVYEADISDASATDNTLSEALGEVCPTATWAEPPYRSDEQSSLYPKPVVGANPYLRGLVGMPNGIMAGFLDNTIAFCEPYIPYAFPVEYQITTEYPIVGLGVFGQTLFVGTTGNPYFVSGTDSASMSAIKLDSNQSCVSRRSIVSVQGGVLYASPDGLCVADGTGVKVITTGAFSREDWQALNPSSMFACEHENVYYLFYNNGTSKCITFDLQGMKLGQIDLSATSAFVDRLNDRMFIADGTSIKSVFNGSSRRTGLWKSKKLTASAQTPLAWLKVLGDQSVSAPATVRWYGDGALVQTLTISDIEPVRLKPGRFLEHELEVESQSRITQIAIAGDTAEMKSI